MKVRRKGNNQSTPSVEYTSQEKDHGFLQQQAAVELLIEMASSFAGHG